MPISAESAAQDEEMFRLAIHGPMTFDVRPLLEEQIISAMRRHRQLEVDLSEVCQIDLFGVHLLGLLRGVGAVVATSPVIDEAAQRLLAGGSRQRAALGRRHYEPGVAAG